MGRGIASLLATLLGFGLVIGSASAQDADSDDGEEVIEEIIAVGSQIRGAKISEALAVSVIDQSDIEVLGIDSGDELLEYMAEQGSNFFSEAENISGGVNAARGDIGAYNLRNLGTGNTLVLLNGRRLVNAASYQTELVGGSFVPVNTVNSQSLPVFGLERVEVLRDGASAIYGADAVAGVVNYVMKNDFEGFSIRTKFSDYGDLPRNDQRITLEYGHNFNNEKTNLSLFADYYHRDRVNSQDDARWTDADFRRRIPETSPWAGSTRFRNNSVNSEFGQFDVISSVASLGLTGDIWDSNGEFEVFPIGHENCEFDLSPTVCGAVDGAGIFRHNLNENRDLFSDLDRMNFMAFLNHEFDNGMESFTEVSAYISRTNTIRHASAKLGAVANYIIPAENYYNPFGVCGNPNRLPDSVIGAAFPCEGVDLRIDNYRWVEAPRIVDNDGETFRVLTGLRGQLGDWDWDTAISWSRAEKEDITNNRISNVLLTEALNDPTPAAYNAFSGRVDTNIERALIAVRRDNQTELKSFDFKISKYDLFEFPAGPVGFLAGVEFREESFDDDRDPRLDGTINFVDNAGTTFPFVSDVVNSSPSADSSGERDVTSVFTELQIPVLENLDVQAALRYEDFSDVGDTTVGKLAFGYRPFEMLLIRGSWSEAFRVPNLVTVNETGVARSNNIDDQTCLAVDPAQDVLDCETSVQRTAGGSSELVPEESTNTSFGIVFDPFESVTVTLDYWEIEKDNTIGLFGEENHSVLDFLIRTQEGTANCATIVGNPSVVRADPGLLSPEDAQLYMDAGLCPVGELQRVNDQYANLDTRTVRGHDLGVYMDFETKAGDFNIRYVASFLDEYTQEAGGDALVLLDAQSAGIIPDNIPIEGFADLVRQDGNPREKHTIRLGWRKQGLGATITGVRTTGFVQTNLSAFAPEVDGEPVLWVLPAHTTFNGSVDYRFDTWRDGRARIRFGINNLTDERAPLADVRFGYFSDVHRDIGRNFYLDLKLDF